MDLFCHLQAAHASEDAKRPSRSWINTHLVERAPVAARRRCSNVSRPRRPCHILQTASSPSATAVSGDPRTRGAQVPLGAPHLGLRLAGTAAAKPAAEPAAATAAAAAAVAGRQALRTRKLPERGCRPVRRCNGRGRELHWTCDTGASTVVAASCSPLSLTLKCALPHKRQ